jgi:hypothetical protein
MLDRRQMMTGGAEMLRYSVNLAAMAVAGLFAGAPLTAVAAENDAGIVREQVSAMTHDEALRVLGEALGRSIEATQADPSIPDILKALENNIAATRRVREMVAGEQVVSDEQIGAVASQISGIAKSFRAIASLAPEIFERRWGELADINAIGEEAGFRINSANARLEALRANNAAIDQQMASQSPDRSLAEMLRLTRQANDAEIHSLEAAVAAWTYFSERHADVVAHLGDQTEDLNVFFHALNENARVYEAAAQTLGIANSLKLALNDLSSVENLDALRSEMVRSWGDLMRIVDEVNDGLKLRPGM